MKLEKEESFHYSRGKENEQVASNHSRSDSRKRLGCSDYKPEIHGLVH